MWIFHGIPSPRKLRHCRRAAPSHIHGAMWNPDRMTGHNVPYALDNGAYAADINGEEWDARPFLDRLDELDERMPRDPEFVVLPDIRGDADASADRTREWADQLADGGFDYPRAVAVQDGMTSDRASTLAADVNADVLFIGGSDQWKVSNAARMVRTAHVEGLAAHIGRPMHLTFAEAVGADSVDTTSIVRNENYARLRAFEEQTTVADFAPTE